MASTLEPLTVGMTEAARLLGVSRPTAYKLANRADFPAFKIDGRIYVSVEGLKAWVTARSREVSA